MFKWVAPKINFYLLSLLLLAWFLFLLLNFYLFSVESKLIFPKSVIIFLIPIVSPLLIGLWISEYTKVSGVFPVLRKGGIRLEELKLKQRRLSLKGKILLYVALFTLLLSVAFSWYFVGFLSWTFTLLSVVLLILIIFVIPQTERDRRREGGTKLP